VNALNAIAVTLALASSALAISQQTIAARGPKPTPLQVPHLSRSELKKLTRDANTPEQYQELAAYYRTKQQTLKDRARGEWSEALSRSIFSTGNRMSPVAISMARYQAFKDEARQAAEKAAFFEDRANTILQAELQ